MVGLTRRDPFRDLVTLQTEMDRFFNNAFRSTNGSTNGGVQNGSTYWTPALDVWETEDGYTLTASLPGVEPDQVDISLVNHVLTIQGEIQPVQAQGQLRLHERPYGKFYRSIQLPATVSSDQIDASYYNGILTLHLPKAEEAKPKRIPVHSNGQTSQRMIEAQAA